MKIMNILAEEAPLDKNFADLIDSEWMGYFLIFERMLPSVVSVRDRCLKPNRIMIPGRAKIILAAFNSVGFTQDDLNQIKSDKIHGEARVIFVRQD